MKEIQRNHLVWLKSVDGNLLTTAELDELARKEKAAFLKSTLPGVAVRSPWERVNGNASHYVWKNADGTPMRDKIYM